MFHHMGYMMLIKHHLFICQVFLWYSYFLSIKGILLPSPVAHWLLGLVDLISMEGRSSIHPLHVYLPLPKKSRGYPLSFPHHFPFPTSIFTLLYPFFPSICSQISYVTFNKYGSFCFNKSLLSPNFILPLLGVMTEKAKAPSLWKLPKLLLFNLIYYLLIYFLLMYNCFTVLC